MQQCNARISRWSRLQTPIGTSMTSYRFCSKAGVHIIFPLTYAAKLMCHISRKVERVELSHILPYHTARSVDDTLPSIWGYCMYDLLEFLNLKMLPILLAGQLSCGVVVRCECSMSANGSAYFFSKSMRHTFSVQG